MSTQEITNPQDAAQLIWDTLDKEDGGAKPSPDAPSNSTAASEANPAPVAAPADQADAHVTGSEEDAPTAREQALLDKIAGLQSQFETTVTDVTKRLRTAEGRIGGLNNQLQQRQPVNQQAGSEAPSAQQVRQAQTDPEAMATLKRDYPEFATAMGAVLDERLTDFERRLAQARPFEQQPAASPDDIVHLRNTLLIEAKHEGWEETVRKPEFGGWLQRQPREVQMLGGSSDPRDAIRLLDLHTAATKPAPQQTDQRLTQAAAIPAGRHASNVRTKPTDQMSEKEYWDYLDQIDRSKKQG